MLNNFVDKAIVSWLDFQVDVLLAVLLTKNAIFQETPRISAGIVDFSDSKLITSTKRRPNTNHRIYHVLLESALDPVT